MTNPQTQPSCLGQPLDLSPSAFGELRRSGDIAGNGDALCFGMGLVHASLDNHTDRIRLSSDSRYQLASEPCDGRWIGENPVGHGLAGKKGKVC